MREAKQQVHDIHEHHRPYIILKWAQTINGFIDDNGQALAISTPFTKMLGHKLRAENDAILVGRVTDEREHPALTVRHWSGRNPRRFVLSHNNTIESILAECHATGLQSLIVEGGLKTHEAFLSAGLWDEIRVETAPITVTGGTPAPTLPADARIISRETYDGNTITTSKMKIGNIEFGQNPLFLAPMEDVTDIGFRMLCKRFGAAMVYTEFVSAEALVRSIKSTVSKLTISEDERPVGIQIYGRDLDAMVEAAKIVEEARPDVIDLNFGCPVKKVAGKGAGAGMLRNIPLMLEITREVVKAVKIPVTVKTRLGWDCNNIIITELAEQLQDCGIQALTIHGRTRSQMYTGEADWTLIGEVKNNPRIHIPIIGNGDIKTPEQAREAFNRYGVDAVMVGRATFGCPWIFKEMKEYILEWRIPA